MKKLLLATGMSLLLAAGAQAQPTNLMTGTNTMIPPGTLAVWKAGDNTGRYNISKSKVAPCFIQIFDPSISNQVSPIISMALPTNQPNGIWINGHAGSEGGGISRTTSRQFLALEGYTGNILSPTAAKPSADNTVDRGLGILDAFGNEQVLFEDQASWFGMPPGVTQNNPTGIASTDGTNFWGTGNTTGTTSEAAGTLFYNANESSQPFELQNYIQGANEARIIGGTLYVVVAGAGIYNFLDPFDNFAVVPLPFDPDVPYPVEHFVTTNLFLSWGNTYQNIANFDMNPQGTIAYGADQQWGIVKFVNTNGNWAQASYSWKSNNLGTYQQPAAQQGCFGICVDFTAANPIIYATTMEYAAGTTGNGQGNPNKNRIIRIVDNGVDPGTNLVAVTLATASTTNETFRGIEFAPDLRPLIATQPSTWATTNTGTAYFSVGAESVYALSYQWLENSNILSGQTNATLELDNQSTNANGSAIQCIVTNAYGAVTSTVATLIVTAQAVPPSVTTVSNKVTSFVGGIVTFPAIVPNGTETFTYQWYFGNTQLADDGSKYYGSQSDSLSITNVQPGDSGNYYLVVSNAAGYSSNLVDILTVNYHPASIPSGEPANVTTFVGSSAYITVAPEGGSTPITNQWYKGTNALSDGNEYSGTQSDTLTINPASLSDAGSYKLVASNPAGSITSSVATLTVIVPPANSSVSYSNQTYIQTFDSLPDPGSNSVNSINNPKDAGSINSVVYSLANPFDFTYPVINQSYIGGLGLSNMNGWYGAADTQYPAVDGITRFGAQDGDQTTGGVIDFGPNDAPGVKGINRALGLLSTGTTGSTTFALKLINTSGNTLNYINTSFVGELWHNGTGHRLMQVGYTIDPSANSFTLTSESISNSTIIPQLEFSFPVAPSVVATDGTQPAYQTNCSVSNLQLSSPWTPGSALWMIWAIDYYGAGSGNGYAIDNLSFSAKASLAAQPSSPVLGHLSYSAPTGSGPNLAGGNIGFTFTNVPGAHFSVYGTTNLTSTNWIYVGSAMENPLGSYSSYSFSDTNIFTNHQRFYRVTSP